MCQVLHCVSLCLLYVLHPFLSKFVRYTCGFLLCNDVFWAIFPMKYNEELAPFKSPSVVAVDRHLCINPGCMFSISEFRMSHIIGFAGVTDDGSLINAVAYDSLSGI